MNPFQHAGRRGSVPAGLRRVRAHAGFFALLAVLVIGAALLLTAAPRLTNRLVDAGLRRDLAGLSWQERDIRYDSTPSFVPTDSAAGTLDRLAQEMPAELRELVVSRWHTAQVGPEGMRATGPDLVTKARPPLDLGLRSMSGARDAVRMASGRWPAAPGVPATPGPTAPGNAVPPAAPAGPDVTGGARVEVAVSTAVAGATGLRAGSRLAVRLGAEPLQVDVVGVFEPLDPAAAVWDGAFGVLRDIPPVSDGEPALAVALAADGTFGGSWAERWPVHRGWRYRLDLRRVDAARAQPVVDDLRHLRQTKPARVTLTAGLETPLRNFLDSLTSVRGLLAVVVTGLTACLGGLILLAARLAVDRRAAELVLIRARGGSAGAVAGRGAVETILVVPAAAATGWLAGTAVPGRSGGTGWLVVLTAVFAVSALPLAAVLGRPALAARRDLATARGSLRRRTAEVAVLALAAVGAFLLRRRGLPPGGTVDPLLASVPVLIAAASALLALRIYPWPLRLAGRLAVRSRGVVAFLGVVRAGRSPATGPVYVLVTAIATATFCGVVANGIRDGRDRAAERAVPADAVVSGDGFSPETAGRLAAVPGVEAVAAAVVRRAAPLRAAGAGPGGTVREVRLLLVDGPAFARVMSAVRTDVPPVLAAARPDGGPVPAVVSPSVAADLPGEGLVSLPEGDREFRVDTVAATFPGVDPDADRFVVLPWQALPAEAGASVVPTMFLVAGDRVGGDALRAVGDRGQRQWLTSGAVAITGREVSTSVTVRSAYRAALDDSGINGLISFAFTVGTAGGCLLGLLAAAFTVLAGAGARRRLLARLRIAGLTRWQWRGILLTELAPLVGLAVLTGAGVGGLLPPLLAPALPLSTFAAGAPVPVRFDTRVLGGVLALVAAGLAVAIAVEELASRRQRLGEES